MFELGKFEKALSDYSTVLTMRQSPWDYLKRSAALSQLNLKEPADRDAEIGFQKLDKMAYKE
jgi:hypothetical protein